MFTLGSGFVGKAIMRASRNCEYREQCRGELRAISPDYLKGIVDSYSTGNKVAGTLNFLIGRLDRIGIRYEVAKEILEERLK